METKNAIRFLELIRSIEREGARINDLANKIGESDFLVAPASTKYHGAYEGGLVEHSLKVYDNLVMINEMKNLGLDENSMKIVGLLHDMSKMNLYVKSVQNKKVYSETGSKYDSLGNYDWVSTPCYVTRPVEERFIYGNHEGTSAFMIRSYIPINYVEEIAILHHMGGKAYDSTKDDVSAIYSRYPLACALHLADMMATYIDEEEPNE